MGLLIRGSACFLLVAFMSMGLVFAAETHTSTEIMQDPDNTWLEPNFPKFNFPNQYLRSTGPRVRFTYPGGKDLELVRRSATSMYQSRFANQSMFSGRTPYDWGQDKFGIANVLFSSPLNGSINWMFMDTGIFRRFLQFGWYRELQFLKVNVKDYPIFAELKYLKGLHGPKQYRSVGQVLSRFPKSRDLFMNRTSVTADLLPPDPIECPVLRDYEYLTHPCMRVEFDLKLSVDGPRQFVMVRHGGDFLRPAIGVRNGKPVAEGPATSKFPDGTEIPREAIRWAY